MRANLAALGAGLSVILVAWIVSTTSHQKPAEVAFSQTPAPPPAAVKDGTSLALLLDTSGSMEEKVTGGESKLQCAKHVLTEDFLPLLPDDTSVALYRFDGASALELSPLRPNGAVDAPRWTHREALMELVDRTRAEGGTPIAASLRQAFSVLEPLAGRRIVLLVTDGEESYEGKGAVLQEVKRLRAANMEVYVVGFNLGDQGGYLKLELGLGHFYFEANGGREALLGAMKDVLGRIEK